MNYSLHLSEASQYLGGNQKLKTIVKDEKNCQNTKSTFVPEVVVYYIVPRDYSGENTALHTVCDVRAQVDTLRQQEIFIAATPATFAVQTAMA